MKKLLLAVFIGLTLYSCSNPEPAHHFKKLNLGLPARPKTKEFVVGDQVYSIQKGSDGHEYYLIHTYANNNYWHYPGCSLCNKQDILKRNP